MSQTNKDFISRETILKCIGDKFQAIIQWSRYSEWCENVTRYFYKAQVLIEILEIHDCKSIGGFDKNQPSPRNLFDRWDWLYRKYHNPEGKRFGCDIVSYEEIRDFFVKQG